MEAWNPQPLTKPRVIAELSRLRFLERASVALAYQVVRLEYTLSPAGQLRAWAKVCLKTGIVLAVPAVLIVPVITFILAGMATWGAYVAAVALNLLLTLVYVMSIAAILSGVFCVVRAKANRRR